MQGTTTLSLLQLFRLPTSEIYQRRYRSKDSQLIAPSSSCCFFMHKVMLEVYIIIGMTLRKAI